jgi:signal transduction histidine kinase
MRRGLSRQLLALIVALGVPSVAIAWLGWEVLVSQRADEARLVKARDDEAVRQIGDELLDRLNGIREHEVLAPALDDYSDPAVALVASAQNGALVLPWQSPEPQPEPFRRAIDDVKRVEGEANTIGITRNQPAAAAELLRGELLRTRDPLQQAYLRILLARTLKQSGHRQEANDVYVDLLNLPSEFVDDARQPQPLWQVYAADLLLDDHARDRDVLSRVKRDLASMPEIARWHKSLRTRLERLRHSSDAAVADSAVHDIDILDVRVVRMEQMRRSPLTKQLTDAFHSLDVNGDRWPLFGQPTPQLDTTGLQKGDRTIAVGVFGPDPALFIGTGPERHDGSSLIVAVWADRVLADIRAARRESGRPAFDLVLDDPAADGRKPLRAAFPHQAVVLKPSAADVARFDTAMTKPTKIYMLTLTVVFGLTLLGGHLVWRDTQREIRIAELRSQFVSSVSHELKTPLTAIRMFAETLQMRGENSQLRSEYLETIVNETERLTRLLNNVLDFSKIERGQKHYHFEPAGLADVMNSVARTMRFPLAEQGFALHLEVAEDLPLMRIDRDAIEQAVLNLLSNAMKYSGDSRQIALRLSSRDGEALIQVMDRGLGIPPEEHALIFEKFYRARAHEHRAISGTGLGLALVSHIAAAHGGRVDVESAVGKGSTFTMRLPLETIATSETTPAALEQAHVGDAS